jgi:hypothetical protein
MQNLTTIIGPAPSELPRAELLAKLSAERDRVRKTLIWFRTNIPVKKQKSKRVGGKPASRITTKMKKAGVSIEQMEAALALLEKEKSNNAE